MVYRWVVNRDFVSKGFLITTLFLCTAGALVYLDYLQETYLFTTRIDLNRVQVDNSSLVFLETLNQLNNITKLTEDHNAVNSTPHSNYNFYLNYISNYSYNEMTSKFDCFPIEPPFPSIDLSYLRPVFEEKGELFLDCKTSFVDFKCRVNGFVKGQKAYLADTMFNESRYETIEFKYTNLDKWEFSPKRFINSNQNQLNKITNYLFLFGYNGTYFPKIETKQDNDELLDSFTSTLKLSQYIDIRAQLIKVLKLEYVKFLFLEIIIIVICSLSMICLITRFIFVLVFKRHLLLAWNPSSFFSKSRIPSFTLKENSSKEEYISDQNQKHISEIMKGSSGNSMTSPKQALPTTRFESYFHYFNQWPSSPVIQSTDDEHEFDQIDIFGKRIECNQSGGNIQKKKVLSEGLETDIRFQYKRNPWFKNLKILYFVIIMIILVYYISFYIINFIIQNKITNLLKGILGTNLSNFKAIENTNEVRIAMSPKIVPRNLETDVKNHQIKHFEQIPPEPAKLFNTILAIVGIVLNTLIFGALHCIHGIALYIYTFS